MKKQLIILIAIAALGIILYSGNKDFNKITRSLFSHTDSLSLPSFSFDSLKISLGGNDTPSHRAWTTFEKYLEFAKNHDLPGLKSLSHQISPVCNDQAQEAECFKLMDSVHAFGSMLEEGAFKNSESDDRQIVLYTEGPGRAFLYFTQDEEKNIKVLGMRFCLDDEATGFQCAQKNANKLDENANGWWDSVESLFYK